MTIEQPDWKEKEQLEKAEVVTRGENSEMCKLRDRVIAHARLSQINPFLCSRKRAMDPKAANATPATDGKRRKVFGIKSSEGNWDPSTSKFVKWPVTPVSANTPDTSTPSSSNPPPQRLQIHSVSSVESEDPENYSGLTTKSSDIVFLVKALDEATPAGETCNDFNSGGSSELKLLHSAIDHVEASQALSESKDSFLAAIDPVQEGSDSSRLIELSELAHNLVDPVIQNSVLFDLVKPAVLSVNVFTKESSASKKSIKDISGKSIAENSPNKPTLVFSPIQDVIKMTCLFSLVCLSKAEPNMSTEATPRPMKRKRCVDASSSPDNMKMLCSGISAMHVSPTQKGSRSVIALSQKSSHSVIALSQVSKSLAACTISEGYPVGKLALENQHPVIAPHVDPCSAPTQEVPGHVSAPTQEDPRHVSDQSRDSSSTDTSADSSSSSDVSSGSSSDASRLAWAGHKLMQAKKPSKVAMKLSRKLKKPKPGVLQKPPPSKKTQTLLDSFLQHAAMDPDQTA